MDAIILRSSQSHTVNTSESCSFWILHALEILDFVYIVIVNSQYDNVN